MLGQDARDGGLREYCATGLQRGADGAVGRLVQRRQQRGVLRRDQGSGLNAQGLGLDDQGLGLMGRPPRPVPPAARRTAPRGSGLRAR